MKHQSIWIAALLLAGAPMCARALDYGPAAPLVATEAGSQQLPLPTAVGNDTARPEIADAGADDAADAGAAATAPEAPHVAPSGASPRPASVRDHPPTVRSKAPAQPASHPAAPATATSWQSLLPGSIQ